jgi:hypothetical protein
MSQIHCKESSQRYSLVPQISDIIIKPLKIEKKTDISWGHNQASNLVDQCYAVLTSLGKNNLHKKLVFITKTTQLMVNREITVVYFENHSRSINTLPGKNTEFFKS